MKKLGDVLVVGSTGLLGSEIVRLFRKRGMAARAMVRVDAEPAKRKAIQNLGASIVPGDLKDPGSLRAACRGIRTVISTASATLSRQSGDSIQSVDEEGSLALIAAAEQEGVEHFVFLSFPPSEVDCQLQRAKRTVEERLRRGALSYTVLQPVDFCEVWLSPALGFDPAHGKARVLGDGNAPVSWISVGDVARFAVAAVEDERWAGRVQPLGGPEALSQLQVVKIFEDLCSVKASIEFVPESVLEGQLRAARNPIEEAFAAIMLTTARGLAVDPGPALELLPGRLLTVREYATQTVATPVREGAK